MIELKGFYYIIDWYEISHSQKLSENFIREFKDNINWDGISYRQNLSNGNLK